MILRPASLDDMSALVALGRRTFIEAFGHLYSPGDLASFLASARSPEAVAAALADPDVAVTLGEIQGEPSGYCMTHFGKAFDERPRPQPTRPAVLGQLYCTSVATGRGLGAALMSDALAEARRRGCDAMQLSVWSGNAGAQRFYQRYGFAKVADIDFWVGNHRDDEFLYELRL